MIRLQNRRVSHNNKTRGFSKVCWQALEFEKLSDVLQPQFVGERTKLFMHNFH